MRSFTTLAILAAAVMPLPAKVYDTAPVFPYSVIPGGLHGQHGWAELRRDVHAYVSYQYEGRIYFTSHKVGLHKGEAVYGSHDQTLRRGRCGNEIAWTPMANTLPARLEGPIVEALDTPEVLATPVEPFTPAWNTTALPSGLNLPALPGLSAPVQTAGLLPVGAGGWVPSGGVVIGGPVGVTTSVAAVATPEPSSWCLGAFGLAVLALAIRARRNG